MLTKKTKMRVRIGIDAHLLSGDAGYRRAGIHHYIAQVLGNLPESDFEYLVYTRHKADFLQRSDMTTISSRWPTEKRAVRILWEHLNWPWQIKRHKLDMLHSTAFVTPLFSSCPEIVTVYDLSFLHFPDQFLRLQQLYLHTQTKRSCQQARHIITISESSRQDIHTFFNIPLSRISVIYPGVDDRYQPLSAEEAGAFRQEIGIGRYLLHVGTLQPRKNIITLLEAFAQLADQELQLVLIGGKGWLFEEIFARIQQLQISERVHFMGYVPDNQMPAWYAAADLFVFPSVYEGFGMPIIEAMAAGTPVVASNQSSIPEAVGEAGLTFDPQNIAECAARIMAVLHDPQLSATMQAKGLAHARQFSWERAGRETAAVYRLAIEE